MIPVGFSPFDVHPDAQRARKEYAEYDEIIGGIVNEISTDVDAQILVYARLLGEVGETIWKKTEKTLAAYDSILNDIEETIKQDAISKIATTISEYQYVIDSIPKGNRIIIGDKICIGRIDINGKCVGVEIPNPGFPPSPPQPPGPGTGDPGPGEPGTPPFPPLPGPGPMPRPRPPAPPSPPGPPLPPPGFPEPPIDDPPTFPPFPPEPGPGPGPGPEPPTPPQPPTPPTEPPGEPPGEPKKECCIDPKNTVCDAGEDGQGANAVGLLTVCAPPPHCRDIQYHSYVPLRYTHPSVSASSECGIHELVNKSASDNDAQIYLDYYNRVFTDDFRNNIAPPLSPGNQLEPEF